jgi:hypothetical protein
VGTEASTARPIQAIWIESERGDQGGDSSASQTKTGSEQTPEKRKKMNEYAVEIRKPRSQSKTQSPKPNVIQKAHDDREAEIYRHEYFVARVDDLRILVAEYL